MTFPTPLRVALAQFRPVLGDLDANAQRILRFAEAARREGAELLVCPELSLLGYPPDDLLERPALPRALERALQALATALPSGIGVLCGAPECPDVPAAADSDEACGAQARPRPLVYNAAWLLRDGRAEVVARKQALPNFGVFDERRHFTPGGETGAFTLAGMPVRVLICEDLWDDAIAGADGAAALHLVINASPFDQGKRAQRRGLLERRSRATAGPWIYVNLVGGQDELVFDGDTQVWQDGRQINQAVALSEALYLQDLHAPATPAAAEPAAATLLADTAFWGAAPAMSDSELLYRVLCAGIRDYFRCNGFRHIFIGLSGGIDSALVLALAADAVGPQRVTAVAMPSPYTAQMSLDDAQAQARALGVRYRVVPIANLAESFAAALDPWHGALPADATEENIQARARGVLLMAMANKAGGLVLATGNKSEMAVGYCTLYGDMCGGYAPIKDVYKMQVYALARWRNRHHPVIPERVITRPPSAELRPEQTDQDSLPPYAVLDVLLERMIEDELSADAIIAQGFNAADVVKVQGLLRFAEFKRRQAAPGPKVTRRAFGRERRYPITARYPTI
ncbi:MAG: NAD+ synthase [Oceanococcaceae bacterium]